MHNLGSLDFHSIWKGETPPHTYIPTQTLSSRMFEFAQYCEVDQWTTVYIPWLGERPPSLYANSEEHKCGITYFL